MWEAFSIQFWMVYKPVAYITGKSWPAQIGLADYTQLPYAWNEAGSIDTMSTFEKEQFTGFTKFHKQHRLVASHIDQNKL